MMRPINSTAATNNQNKQNEKEAEAQKRPIAWLSKKCTIRTVSKHL
jgi:hypothetical protein